jgi:cellulose synthase/poly-beta-1,6-N-acetylglucosamine synthase-like glycosyltransferase
MANKTRKSKGDYVVAIPSYKRTETLSEKTLKMLESYKIPASKIFIFVADKDEEASYRNALDAKRYNKIVVGIKGLAPVRNFIAGYFPVGKKIVFCDDDIKGFLEFDETKNRHERPLVSLDTIIKRGFQECAKSGSRLWGVYPIPNGFFMKDTVSTDLKFCVGSFFGLVNPGTKALTIPISEKEDYYRTLRMYELDGSVVRLNFVAPKTAYYKEPGGMQTDPERKEKQEKAVQFLEKTFPDWVKRNPNRKSGFPEIRIKASKQKEDA